MSISNSARRQFVRDQLATFPTPKPDIGSQELTDELIRIRAYLLYEQRGGEHGHDTEDWLEAEAEVFGKRLREGISDNATEDRVAAAAA
jgi:hypothetical protein